MRNNPRDWRIDDLKSVANRFMPLNKAPLDLSVAGRMGGAPGSWGAQPIIGHRVMGCGRQTTPIFTHPTPLLDACAQHVPILVCGALFRGMNRFGIDWRKEGGSHHVFSFPGVEDDVCVPAHRPIKPVYVRQFVALVDKAKELQS